MTDTITSIVNDRLTALEEENQTLREAIASLETGIQAHKPMRLREPQHRGLRAVIEATHREPSREPFVRPTQLHYDMAPKETRPMATDDQETRDA